MSSCRREGTKGRTVPHFTTVGNHDDDISNIKLYDMLAFRSI